MPIINRRARLKARRIFRRQKRQAENVVAVADENVERLFLKRLHRLFAVKRFVFFWIVFVVFLGFSSVWQLQALDKFYLTSRPTAGGVYREGILGSFNNANPLFVSSPVDASVSELLFSGLFKQAPNGDLKPELALDVIIDETGRQYDVTLRDDVLWHDGARFSADDVVFTYQTIQNPNVKSSIRNNWVGVTVEKVDEFQVRFLLPSALSSFQYSLVNGIVPKHVLSEIDPEDLRSSNFNTVEPVGTGPFKMRRLEVLGNDLETRRERIALQQNPTYFKGKVALDGIVVQSYRSEEAMVQDFQEQSIQAMVGLNSVPDFIAEDENIRLLEAPLTSAVMVFFNTSTPILQDVAVRKALVRATDVEAVRGSLGFEAIAVDSPFLKNHFAYNPENVQFPYDPLVAQQELEAAGWVLNENGVRVKDGVELRIRLVSQSLSEYASIAQRLQRDWGLVGVQVEAVLQPEQDIQLNAISRHDYDALLYGIAIGYDPDVFAFWHSSQAPVTAQSRLNLSEFSNAIADEALEAGRTRIDEELRRVKYDPFLSVWRDEAPAIGLYQPRFVMVVRGTLDGFEGGQFTRAVNRFYAVENWKVRNSQEVINPL
jgi:peptide/nickel transport system substrate-binding protein